jgi:predicted protein tyrosine phosphatase
LTTLVGGNRPTHYTRQMNILFICSRNKWRSATAEKIYKTHSKHQFRSAGTEPSAVIRVSLKLVNWSDLIFVMEKRHKQRLIEKFGDDGISEKIIVLDIPDEYEFMDPELIGMIKLSVDPFLN